MNEVLTRWSTIRRLCSAAAEIGGLEVWVFGSAMRVADPRDLDILVVYTDRGALRRLLDTEYWELNVPPVDLIGMLREEVAELRFLEVTGATRVQHAT